MDNRKTLFDYNVETLVLDGTVYYLDAHEEVGRGGTCLVYHASRLDVKGAPRKVIVKEFYPVLENQYDGEISRRDDGMLCISEAAKESVLYRQKRGRFLESYEVFKYFYNEKTTNNYILQGQELYENGDTGAVYLIVDYSNAISMEKYIQTGPSLYDFLTYLKQTAKAAGKLHSLGYVHFDLKPDNVLVYADGYVKFMDVDSVLKKDVFLEEEKEVYLSVSDGYTAPDVMTYDSSNFTERMRFAGRGEAADIYSIGAVLYRYLYGEPLIFMDIQSGVMDREKRDSCLLERIYEKNLDEKIKAVYEDCPKKAAALIRDFLRYTLTVLTADRINSVDILIQIIDEILPLVKPGTVWLCDNFVPNPGPVFGRGEQIKKMENLFLSQRARGGSRIICISGIGGIGKSTLAREYGRLHENEYDVILEVSAASARSVVGLIGLLNWKEEEDGNLSKEEYYLARKKIVKKCMKEQKTLLIVHDYNVPDDPDFMDLRELGCDIILTSRNDWAKSGIPTIFLLTEDLAPEGNETAAKELFAYYYLENARERGDEEWLKSLSGCLEEEAENYERLLRLLEYHPLGIKLMAKQMAYFPGAELKPSEVIGRNRVLVPGEANMLDFQNERDHQVREHSAYGHLRWVYEGVLGWNGLRSQEWMALKFMTLVPAEYGISGARFQLWTGLSRVWLERLRQKGWIEFYPGRADVLDDNGKETGIYVMPMVLGEVISGEEGRMTREEMEPWFHYVMRSVNGYSTHCRRKALAVHQEKLISRLMDDWTEEYADALKQAAYSIALTDGSYAAGEICISCYENILEIYRDLPGEYENEILQIYNNLSALSYEMADLDRADFYMKQALDILKKCKNADVKTMMTTMLSLGTIHLEHGNFQNASAWQKEALKLAEKLPEDQNAYLRAQCYYQAGYQCYLEGQWAEAENYLADAQKLAWQEKQYVFYSRCMEYLAKLQRDIRDYDLSIKCYGVVLDVRKKVLGEDHNLTKQCGEEMAKVLLKAERYEEAFLMEPSLKDRELAAMERERDIYVDQSVETLEKGLVVQGLLLAEKALDLEEYFMTPEELKAEYRTIGNLFRKYGLYGRAELYDILLQQLNEG